MAENRISKKWIRHHWNYNWWKYLLLTALCAAVVDVAFTMTAYRPPEEKKIELYILNGYCDAVALQEDISPLFFERYPEQEELTVLNIDLAGDDMYAPMQFSAYTAAQQGDVCLMPLSEMNKLASDGAEHAFMELTPYIESGAIDVTGIDLTNGISQNSAGEEGVYGIPADDLYGLLKFGNDPAGSVLCVMDYNGNEDHAVGMINLLLERYRTEKPEGYGEEKQEQPAVRF